MVNFTSNTYKMKREILTFSNKISKKLSKPSKKINSVDRLSKHLAKGIPQAALIAYLAQVKKMCPKNPVIHIDDSDVAKPEGYKFESLGWVRDVSETGFSGAGLCYPSDSKA